MTRRYRFMVCARADDAGCPILPHPVPEAVVGEIEWCADASAARARARVNADLEAVWVVDCASVDPINLAAALKADHPRLTVFLAVPDKTGSMASRVRAAGIEEAVPLEKFADHVAGYIAKRRASDSDAVVQVTSEALEAPPQRAASRAGFVLSVMSGGGGVGKSTVATLAARLGAQRGLRTALVDGDLQFGDLAELAGSCARVPVEEAAGDAARLGEIEGEPLVLVSAPRSLEQSEVVATGFKEMIDELSARFDLVVVNTGGSWSDQHLALLERSAAALLLVDQRASSIRACRHALDLRLRCGVATGSLLVAVNRCTRQASFTSIDVSSALNGMHVVELADGGPVVEELLGAGMADRLVEDRNPLCLSIEKVLDELLPSASRRTGVQASVARFSLRPGRPHRRKTERKKAERRLAAKAAAEESGGRP